MSVSIHKCRPFVAFSYNIKLGYLKDSNAAVHSVDSDIFYVVIYLSVRSKS